MSAKLRERLETLRDSLLRQLEDEPFDPGYLGLLADTLVVLHHLETPLDKESVGVSSC
jgi:hypothetical protein